MALTNTILPPTPIPAREQKKIETPNTTKTNATPVTPATVVKKKAGPLCKKEMDKQTTETKRAPVKQKVEMVEIVDEEGFVTVGKAGKKAKVPSPEEDRKFTK